MRVINPDVFARSRNEGDSMSSVRHVWRTSNRAIRTTSTAALERARNIIEIHGETSAISHMN